MQLCNLSQVEWNLLLLGGIWWWAGGGQKIFCQGGESWRAGIILPELYLKLTDFQCAIHIWWTHGPILKKDLLTFRIQNKKCRVGRAHNIFCCACACAHITLISHHGYCLPQFLLASHYCSLTSDWLALVVPTYTGPCCKTSGAAINRTGSKARNAPRTSEVMHFLQGWSREWGGWKGRELDKNRAK